MLDIQHFVKKMNKFFKLFGMSIYNKDTNLNLNQYLKTYWIYVCHQIIFNYAIMAQIAWAVEGVILGKTITELTFLLPCLFLCLLGDVKVYHIHRNATEVNNIIDILSRLGKNPVLNDSLNIKIGKSIALLSSVFRLTLMLVITGGGLFCSLPMVTMSVNYITTGHTKLYLPFLVWYPFDEFDVRYWPIAYVQQVQSAWVAIFSIFAADCLFCTCCTYIHVQFMVLQNKIEEGFNNNLRYRSNFEHGLFMKEFVEIVDFHRELIRCVKVVELVFSKSTLINVVTSSMIICAAGFNLMVLDNLALMAPFVPFLFYGMIQVFVFCYYGDFIKDSSIGVGDAIYNSDWYMLKASQRKYLLITLLRSQKPCVLTAYGYSNIELRTFTRILSTSWSYFALLQQMFKN